MFFWPSLFASLALFLRAFTANKAVSHLLFSAVEACTLLIFVPLLYSLFIAVTVGGLLALALLFAFALSVLLPSCFMQSNLTAAKAEE